MMTRPYIITYMCICGEESFLTTRSAECPLEACPNPDELMSNQRLTPVISRSVWVHSSSLVIVKKHYRDPV